MRILHMLLFIIFAAHLEAEVKWIPIESIESKKEIKKNTGISNKEIRELQPVKKMVENAKAIQHLLDNKHNKKKQNSDSQENWYVIENLENNK